ncbi:Protein STRUBBELIG-RECEPTOR FAMILY 1 [Acorus gramineus]|uniref:Protein STRUBBELIG-RECEPTOR FAMILY 1 n=1 Tax=Acorus gramineus TaxID=55184 RepID=A0AAV9A8N4_ACOGR|nr:Protein STRUBBELIG-RECEPTOR FAMILY 1 [Acorus gramineus]
MEGKIVRIIGLIFTGLIMVLTVKFSHALTDEQDVFAIINLYIALGSPPLPGWNPNSGDPCVEQWQGVQCVGPNITSIVLNGANLGGQLGDKLNNFSSIMIIDLSNNHIGGPIPDNLPRTMQNFFLSDNQFTGSIPSSLSTLSFLTAMSLNDNLLTGELPDAFQSLPSLTNLDLSSNNLSGQLPPTMENLSSLTTLHVQNNQLSGLLDVLQDLPIQDLNIENNLFSGPVPTKLLSIPNFKKDGNPFNTSVAPSPSFSPPTPSLSPPTPGAPPSEVTPASADGPSVVHGSHSHPVKHKKFLTTSKVIAIGIAGVLIFIALLLLIFLCLCRERKSKRDEFPIRPEVRAYSSPKREPKPIANVSHVTKEDDEVKKVPEKAIQKQKEEHEIDMTESGVILLPGPVENVIANPIVPPERKPESPPKNLNPPTSATSFSIASLQQYTANFGEVNLIRDDRLGKVYRAELPDGKLLTVMKLDNVNSMLKMDEFLDLVLTISELRHPNIVELVGYCAEHEQRLLVYNYFSDRSLHDILHAGDELKMNVSWVARIKIALGAARALEYLHEGCEPPIIHRNFESATLLVNDEHDVCVSDCGLASLDLSRSVTQLSGRIRLFSSEAPEFNESGVYTVKSDVYRFGVMMLELLTGRQPYDSLRPSGEQHLVRWAVPQLHDINALSRMVDPSITGKYPVKSLSRFTDIISRCIQTGPEFRPPMSEIVQDLRCMLEELTNKRPPNQESRSA